LEGSAKFGSRRLRPKAGYSTPMFRVRDVDRSILFYEQLGFWLVDSEGSPPGWARLHCTDGAIMLLADLPFDVVVAASRQMFSLVMYVSDLPALCEQLREKGMTVPDIAYPAYMPSGQIGLTDPDGYAVTICHGGSEQQNAWEERLSKRASRG
jgi:catechol 2,3-dioxygenase-like lactoylglutathione lyase family enzyme